VRGEGKIGANIAMVSIADGFGIDLSTAARNGFGKAGFKLVYDKSYPIGTQDMAPLIGEAQRSGADVFVAFSYPPDTFALTEQSKISSYAPKVMFLGVGTGFPIYPQKFGTGVEGVISLGAGLGTTRERRTTTRSTRRCSSAAPTAGAARSAMPRCRCWSRRSSASARSTARPSSASCRPAPSTRFWARFKLENNMPKDAFWLIGQWQNGFFTGVSPQRAGASRW